MRAILVVVIALAGCFSPSTRACEYTCGAGGSCPASLVCNAQNMCAAATTDVCSAMPDDDATIDTDAPSDRVTVSVFDELGAPLPSANVIFLDPVGTELASLRTDATGRVSAMVPPGSSVTVVRARPAVVGTRYEVTSFVGVAAGMHLRSRAIDPQATRVVTVDFVPPPGYSATAYASCVSRVTATPNGAQIDVLAACPTVDVVAWATAAGASPVAAYLPGVTTQATITAWEPVATLTSSVAPIPTEAATVQLTAGPWSSADRGTPFGFSVVNLSVFNATGMQGIIDTAGVTTALIFQQGGAMVPPSEQRFLRVADRFPPGTRAISRNVDGVLVPWVAGPSFMPASRRVLWSHDLPNGVVPAPSFGTAALLEYNVPTGRTIWRTIIAPQQTSSLMGSPGGGFTLIDVPGNQPFEPAPDQTASVVEVQYFGTSEPAMQAMFEHFEPATLTDAIFAVPGITHVTRAHARVMPVP